MTDTQTINSSTANVEVEGAVATVTLHRGEKNMIEAEMTKELVSRLRELDTDQSIKAVILTGHGEFFCGGADGPHIRETETARPFADAAVELFELMASMGTPIIAAVNGDALAGGFGLVCSADIVIAVDTAKLGTIEASLGTWPAIAQGPALRRLSEKAALRNILTGIPFSAEESAQFGLVDEVVSAEDLQQRVQHYAELVQQAGPATALCRPLAYQALDSDYSASLRRGANAFVELFSK